MGAPAMKMTMVIEASQDSEFVPRLIPLLAARPLAEIIDEPFVAERIPPLLERHQRSIEILREHSASESRTVFSTSPASSWRATTSSSLTSCIPAASTAWD